MSTHAPSPGADLLARVWRLLPHLSHVAFSATPGPASTTRWCGRGQGRVDVYADGDDWRMHEQGRFALQGGAREVAFRNVYRWQRQDAAIALYHERFGAHAPVFLFAWVATGDGRLVSREAHVCVADRYRATLILADDGMRMRWHVQGPAKDEHLDYHYGVDALV